MTVYDSHYINRSLHIFLKTFRVIKIVLSPKCREIGIPGHVQGAGIVGGHADPRLETTRTVGIDEEAKETVVKVSEIVET